jgi:acetaldehyde dehydrogenase
VSCGGKRRLPLVNALKQVAPVGYAEIVATIASKSAGPGTRQNIDEFTETLRGLEKSAAPRQGRLSFSASHRSSCATPCTV